MNIKNLSDNELHAKIKGLVKNERELLTEILRHLAEIERRRLYSFYKCNSLFDYCIRRLGYSEPQAQRRINASRLICEIPEVEEKISSGALSLTNVAQAQTFFKQENKARKGTLFGENKTSKIKEVEKREILRKLENTSTRKAQDVFLKHSTNPQRMKEKERALGEERTEIRLIAGAELTRKMTRIRGLLAHKKGHMSLKELLTAVCDMALEKLDPLRGRKKLVKTISPAKPCVKTRNIPQAVKRKVWSRSGQRCENCGSQYALEIDHRTPWALGGGNGINNLHLLCRCCNQRAAINQFGMGKMEKYLNRTQNSAG